MEKLATYVAAIRASSGPLSVAGTRTEKLSWHDQGFEVSQDVTDYRFDNGAVVRRTVEQDDFPSDAACAECWITYEVISAGTVATGISPAKIRFQNACRESFWLTYHTTPVIPRSES